MNIKFETLIYALGRRFKKDIISTDCQTIPYRAELWKMCTW